MDAHRVVLVRALKQCAHDRGARAHECIALLHRPARARIIIEKQFITFIIIIVRVRAVYWPPRTWPERERVAPARITNISALLKWPFRDGAGALIYGRGLLTWIRGARSRQSPFVCCRWSARVCVQTRAYGPVTLHEAAAICAPEPGSWALVLPAPVAGQFGAGRLARRSCEPSERKCRAK